MIVLNATEVKLVIIYFTYKNFIKYNFSVLNFYWESLIVEENY